MPLRSGKTAFIDHPLRDEISSTKHDLCTIAQILEFSKSSSIVAVGDVTSEAIRSAGIVPVLEVVDLKTKRGERTFSHVEGSVRVVNPPGQLTSELFLSVEEILHDGKPCRMEVEGEEDLAVIPIIYYALENTVVAYGVPDKGIACIRVSADVKKYVRSLVKRLEFK
jgi:uncharacterized protein (UPF0218 family)